MARITRIVVKRQGVRDLLRAPEVAEDIQRRAAAIAAAAGPGMETDFQEGGGRGAGGRFLRNRRVRASVRTATHEARVAEATRRTLTSAIDAGR